MRRILQRLDTAAKGWSQSTSVTKNLEAFNGQSETRTVRRVRKDAELASKEGGGGRGDSNKEVRVLGMIRKGIFRYRNEEEGLCSTRLIEVPVDGHHTITGSGEGLERAKRQINGVTIGAGGANVSNNDLDGVAVVGIRDVHTLSAEG